MPALVIITITVTDKEKFSEYLGKTKMVASKFGAKLLFQARKAATLAGEPVAGELAVIAQFPDLETVERWHNSPEYAEIVPLREAGSIQVMTAYEAA